MPIMTLLKDPETGLLKAELSPENGVLCDFFESEIQQDRAFIAFLKAQAEDRESLPFEINGNAHTLTLTGPQYEITSLQSGETTSGPLSDLLDLLRQWDGFLRGE